MSNTTQTRRIIMCEFALLAAVIGYTVTYWLRVTNHIIDNKYLLTVQPNYLMLAGCGTPSA